MNLDVTNFSAERLVMGQKVEAAALRVRADNQGYVLRGDVKINGIPALLEYQQAARPGRRGGPRRGHARRGRAARGSASIWPALSPARCRCRINGRVPIDERRQPLFGRGRPDAGAHRPAAAGLGQARRPAGAHVVHHDQPAAIHAARRSVDRRRRAFGQGHASRSTARATSMAANLTELQPLRRRQGDAAGRARPRRRAARDGARRRL